MIITIDGISGQGKSTIGKMLSEKIGFEFFSTGILVRYAASELMKNSNKKISREEIVSQIDIEQVKKIVPSLLNTMEIIPYFKIVTDSKYCVEKLYHLINDYCIGRNIILDGRDTFVYLPQAELKYFFESKIEDRVFLRMKVTGFAEKDCYEYFKKRDSVEREIHVPYDKLIIIRPFESTIEELINKMYEDVSKIKR